MLEIKRTGICVWCNHADLKLKQIEFMGKKMWTVSCKHEAVCGDWEKRVQRITGESEDSAIYEQMELMNFEGAESD